MSGGGGGAAGHVGSAGAKAAHGAPVHVHPDFDFGGGAGAAGADAGAEAPRRAEAEAGAGAGGSGSGAGAGRSGSGGVDYTAIVAEMDGRIERLDRGGTLRPTVISVGAVWHKSSRPGLLGATRSSTLGEAQQRGEKERAFGLLDALTRGGGLALQETALHVVVAATHHFDKSVMQTVVQDNANPIESVERSALILASVVHRVPVRQLLGDTDWHRISASSPALLAESSE